MTETSLLVHGVTRARFSRLRELMSDARLPLVFHLNCELTISDQLVTSTDAELYSQTATLEREMLILRQNQVELLPRLRQLWQQNLGNVPIFVLITGSNREWTGSDLLQRIDQELTLIENYNLKNPGR
jgi:hypothetical protein